MQERFVIVLLLIVGLSEVCLRHTFGNSALVGHHKRRMMEKLYRPAIGVGHSVPSYSPDSIAFIVAVHPNKPQVFPSSAAFSPAQRISRASIHQHTPGRRLRDDCKVLQTLLMATEMLEEPRPPSSETSKLVSSVVEKIEYIRKLIRYWEQTIASIEFTPSFLAPYLPALSESFFFEDVMKHLHHNCKSGELALTRAKLNRISEAVQPAITNYRLEKATSKLKVLLSALLAGTEVWDQKIGMLLDEQEADIHLLQLLESKIQDARTLYGNGKGASLSEKLLKIVQDRIVAEKAMEKKGTAVFVKIVSHILRNKASKEERRNIIKENIKRIEDFENFHEWLQEAIQYTEAKPETANFNVSEIKVILRELENLNPVVTQSLNKQGDTDTFTPSEVDIDEVLNSFQ